MHVYVNTDLMATVYVDKCYIKYMYVSSFYIYR